jgi:hypothetical protein
MVPPPPTKLVRRPTTEGRLLLVSNRLPITIKRSDEGKYDFSMSSGGLVSGLSGLSKSTTFQWYGWPGLEIPENEIAGLKEQLKKEHNAVPVMLDDDLADRHYNGFSSKLRSACAKQTHTDLQTLSFGLCSITTPERLPSTSRHGTHTPKPIAYSPRPSRKTYRTMIWFGSTTTT